MKVVKEYSGVKVTINEEDLNKKGVIYLLEFPNGKVYVGQTQNVFRERLSNHCSKSSGCIKIKAATQKYKELAATVLEDDCTIQELNYLEQYYIELFNAVGGSGYNLESGGRNKIVSEETKNKIRLASQRKKTVQSLPDGFIFQSITDAGEFYGIDGGHLHRYLYGEKHPMSGQTFIIITD